MIDRAEITAAVQHALARGVTAREVVDLVLGMATDREPTPNGGVAVRVCVAMASDDCWIASGDVSEDRNETRSRLLDMFDHDEEIAFRWIEATVPPYGPHNEPKVKAVVEATP